MADYTISIISWVWEKRAHRWNNTQIFQVASQRKKYSTSLSWQTCSGVEGWRKSDETGEWIILNCFLSIYTSAFYLFLLFFGENSRWISSFSGVGPPKTALTEKPPNFFRSQGWRVWPEPILNITTASFNAQRNVKFQHLRYCNGVKLTVVFLSFCRAANRRVENGNAFKKKHALNC